MQMLGRDKVEIVRIEKPENSYAALEEMVEHVKGLLRALELPYRQLLLCGGDMGFASALTYDMEVYSAAQERWLEVSSISNFETFQSNRLKLRYREDKPASAKGSGGGSKPASRTVLADSRISSARRWPCCTTRLKKYAPCSLQSMEGKVSCSVGSTWSSTP